MAQLCSLVEFLALENNNVCISGGASGADTKWATQCAINGIEVTIMSFQDHRCTLDYSCYRVVLTPKELNDARVALVEANQFLKRKNVESNYLKRDFYQIKFAESVYAVGWFSEDSKVPGAVNIKGGTAWGCQLFILRYAKKFGLFANKKSLTVPLYFFDMFQNKWFQALAQTNSFQVTKVEWHVIEQPAKPSGKFAGIGSRDMNRDGSDAIENILQL